VSDRARRVSILGPTRAWAGADEVALGGRRQRAVLARLVIAAGDADTCRLLVSALTPVADHVTVTGMGAVSIGHCSRYLGLAQAGAGDLDAAEATLAQAAEQAGAAGFAPWRARALADWATVLDERGGPGDAALAAQLRAEAEDLAADLGIALGPRSAAPS